MNIERVEPNAAKELLDSGDGYVYLDVRTQEEFDAGHPPGAICIPAFLRGPMGMEPNPEFVAAANEKFAKDTKIITACLRGGRSLKAAAALIADGFTNVVDMRGGYDGEVDPQGNVVFEGWARRGLPTTTE